MDTDVLYDARTDNEWRTVVLTWLAITTEPGKARIVRRRLRRDGINAYLPAIVIKETVLRSNKAKRHRRIMPLMSYVLVEEPREFAVRHLMLHHVLETRGVTGYVGIKGLGPSIIPNSDIEALRTRIANMLFEQQAARHKSYLRKGSRARIKAGPLAGKTGTITWANKQKAEIEAMLFGGLRTITVRRDDLEAA